MITLEEVTSGYAGKFNGINFRVRSVKLLSFMRMANRAGYKIEFC